MIESTFLLPPAEGKLRAVHTLPVEVLSSRLHVPRTPGILRSDHYRHRSLSRHRQAQRGDGHGEHRFGYHRRDKSDALPHLAAGILKEREKRLQQTKLSRPYPVNSRCVDQDSDTEDDDDGHAGQIVSAGIENGVGRLRVGTSWQKTLRRISSDPRMSQQFAGQAPTVEILLDFAEAKKRVRRAKVSQAEVEKLRQKNRRDEEELKHRLMALRKVSLELIGQLDHSYYCLLETINQATVTADSFHMLSTQSKELVQRLAEESSELESDVKSRVERLNESFDQRQDRVQQLDQRGEAAHVQARELTLRLEKVTRKLSAWEQKDKAERKRRSRFWRSTVIIVLVIFAAAFFIGSFPASPEKIVDFLLLTTGHGAEAGHSNQKDNRNHSWPFDEAVVSAMVGSDGMRSISSQVSQLGRRSPSPSPSPNSGSSLSLSLTPRLDANPSSDVVPSSRLSVGSGMDDYQRDAWIHILDEL